MEDISRFRCATGFCDTLIWIFGDPVLGSQPSRLLLLAFFVTCETLFQNLWPVVSKNVEIPPAFKMMTCFRFHDIYS